MTALSCTYLGLWGYAAARACQEQLAKEVATGDRSGIVLFLEHPAVFTVGRNARIDPEVQRRADAHGVEVVRAQRGGGLTWHGPGQLVVYPVLPLRAAGRGVRSFVEGLTRGIQLAFEAEGVSAQCRSGTPGLFVETAVGMGKIASIGLAVRRGITLHGAALNLDRRAEEGFLGLEPCGIAGMTATSLATATGREAPGPEAFAHRLAPLLAQELDFSSATFVPAPGMES